jgi:hypothetical protein
LVNGGPDKTLLLELLQQQGAAAAQLGIVQANLALLLEDRGRAAESRGRIYDKLEKVDDRVARCEAVIPTVERITPLVDQLERDRQRVIGGGHVARGIAKSLWMLLGAAGAAVGWLLHEYLPRLFGPHH